MSQRSGLCPSGGLVPCIVHLFPLNGTRVFDKQPVHPRAPQESCRRQHMTTMRHTHTRSRHTSTFPRVFWGHRNTTHRPHTCHSHEAPPLSSALPRKHTRKTHISAVIGRPRVPVNLLMRLHGSCRVLLPPRGRPTCLPVSFTAAHVHCLMDCLA